VSPHSHAVAGLLGGDETFEHRNGTFILKNTFANNAFENFEIAA
jgi:hypothetical protein